MDFELKTASKALKEAKNDLEKAIEKLTAQATTIVKTSSAEFIKKKALSKCVPPTTNEVIQLMLYLTDFLENATSNCLFCLSGLEGESLKLRTCT